MLLDLIDFDDFVEHLDETVSLELIALMLLERGKKIEKID